MAKINPVLAEGIHKSLVQNVRENYPRYYRLAYSFVKNEQAAADIISKGIYFSLYNGRKLKGTPDTTLWFLQLVVREGMRAMYRNNFERAFTANSRHYALMETLEPSAVNCFKLYYFEELSMEKTAEVLHFDVREVEKRLESAVKGLGLDAVSEEEADKILAEMQDVYESAPAPAGLEAAVEDAIAREEQNFAKYLTSTKRNAVLKPVGLVVLCAALFVLTVAAGRSNPDFAQAVMAMPFMEKIFGGFF
ncbi:MAG: hypothetical protein K6F52_04075 [Clostridia bacterium]|nr:hypothetical protein [Clostridia bacterium]